MPGVPRGISSPNSLGAGTTVIRASHVLRKLARVTLNPTLRAGEARRGREDSGDTRDWTLAPGTLPST